MLYRGAYLTKTSSHRFSVASLFCVFLLLFMTHAWAEETWFAGDALRGASEVDVVVSATNVVKQAVITSEITPKADPSDEVVGSIPATVNRTAKTRRHVKSKKTKRFVGNSFKCSTVN